MPATPVTVKTTSAKWTLSAIDWLKALAAAVLTPVIPIVTQTLQNGSLTLPWKPIEIAAALGFIGMIGKKLLTPAQTVITGADTGSTVNVTTPPPGTTTTTVAVK